MEKPIYHLDLSPYIAEYAFKCPQCQIVIKVSVNQADTHKQLFQQKTINCPWCPTQIPFDPQLFIERFDR